MPSTVSPIPLPEHVTAAELAHSACITVDTVRNWVRRGILPPPVKIGHKRLWRRADVEALLQGQRQPLEAVSA